MSFILNDWSRIVENAEWGPLRLMRCVSHGNYIYVTGGNPNAFGGRTDNVYRSLDGITWELLTDNPGWAARAAHGFLYYGGKFWVFGGSDAAAGFLNDVWSSDDCITWNQETAAAPWSTRHEFAYCIHDGKIYLSGGFSGAGYKNDVWSFDGTTWNQECVNIDVAIVGIREHVMSSYLGVLWIYGGNTGFALSTNNIYRSADNGVNWTDVGNAAWGVRREHQLLISPYSTPIAPLAIVGGYNAIAGSSYNDVWQTTNGTTFTEIAQINAYTPRSDFGFVHHNGYAYIIGGTSDTGGTILGDVWRAKAERNISFTGSPRSGRTPLRVDFTLEF